VQRCPPGPRPVSRRRGADGGPADPDRQFDLVGKHIARIRHDQGRKASRVFVYVERNLGFEAGIMQRVYSRTARTARSIWNHLPDFFDQLIQLI